MNSQKFNNYLFSMFFALFLCMGIASANDEHWDCNAGDNDKLNIIFGYEDKTAYIGVNGSVTHTDGFSKKHELLASISMCHNTFFPNRQITIKKLKPEVWSLLAPDNADTVATELFCTKVIGARMPAETANTKLKNLGIETPLLEKNKGNCSGCCAVS